MENCKLRKPARAAALGLVMGVVLESAGCASTRPALFAHDLEVQSYTSNAVLVDPVARDRRKVFVQVRCDAAVRLNRVAFEHWVKSQFIANDNSYAVVDDPGAAGYILTAYVQNPQLASMSEAHMALHSGFQNEGGAWPLPSALDVSAARRRTAEPAFMLISDIQIQARPNCENSAELAPVTPAFDTPPACSGPAPGPPLKQYRTRIVTTAHTANAQVEQVLEVMLAKTAHAIAWLF